MKENDWLEIKVDILWTEKLYNSLIDLNAASSVQDAVSKSAFKFEREVKKATPVDTWRLRWGFTTTFGLLWNYRWKVYNNVEYWVDVNKTHPTKSWFFERSFEDVKPFIDKTLNSIWDDLELKYSNKWF